ncbi:MAG: PAS domain S-box protein [Halarcobacter sp.]
MKTTFSLKLFLAFLVFGFILFFSSFYLSYTIFNKIFKKDKINTYLELVDRHENELQKLINHQKFLLKQIHDTVEYKTFDKHSLEKSLSTIILSDDSLIELSILKNNTGKELINLSEDNQKIVIEKDYFETLSSFEIFSDILKLKNNSIYNSAIKLNKKDAEIISPLEPIIYFAIKDNKYTIISKVDVSEFLESLSFVSYIIDEDKNIIYDKNNIYSWSRYFYSDLDLKNVIKAYGDYLLNSNSSISSNYYYFKKIKVNGKIYLNIILNNSDISFKEFLDKYESSIYAVMYMSFIVALLLALVFTSPLSNINKKLISEKNLLNDSMEKNKLILSDALELINQYVMYIKVDPSWNIVDISSYFCKVSGYQKEELIGHPYKKLLDQKSYEEFDEVVEYLKDKNIWSGELLSVKKLGLEYWVSSQIETNYNQNKEIISYTEIRTNIDDKKRIEKLYNDLNYQIEQLNVIFQNANSGIALINIDGKFKKFNSAFFNIFQYSEDELFEENFFELADDTSKNLLLDISNELKEIDSISNVELVFLTKNNEEIYLDVSLRILPDKKNIVLVINSLEDKRKLQELNQTLEQRVSDEVQKNIEKDRLHQDQQIKNAKLTSIGTLAAGITHEINTPLTYLKGNFEMLQMDIEDLPHTKIKEDMEEGCSKIEEAINRIAVIVESMREMSQSSSVAKEKSNIYATLITSLTMAYNVSKQISKIYLNNEIFSITNINKTKFEFYSDIQKQRIEQVWIIIINNALDALKNIEDYEKRELNILVYEQEDEVIVKFTDNAGGIKDEIIDKIFDPFISTKQHSGMGVGLNIAKKIIDEQDGEIVAYNKDSGAVFEVRLKRSV